jgi:hypothetical protein
MNFEIFTMVLVWGLNEPAPTNAQVVDEIVLAVLG